MCQVQMESEFYSRATGRLKKASYGAFGDNSRRGSVASTIHTLADEEDNSKQYPTGKLSMSQKKYIESFLQGITQNSHVNIDAEVRAMHWIGMWACLDRSSMVSCCMLQPHISNGMVHTNCVSHNEIAKHVDSHFKDIGYGVPSVRSPHRNPQLHGKFAVPLADSLMEAGLANSSNISFNLTVMSETQPVFIVCLKGTVNKCKMTHQSCRVLADSHPEHVGIVGPTSRGQSYSFRSIGAQSSNGTGPCITIHKSGTLQYQGKPESAFQVGRCFRDCLYHIMESSSCVAFLKSLAVAEIVEI